MTTDYYYKLLGLSRTATNAEVSKAYRRQTRLWRSRLNAPDLQLRQEAERKLQELDTAKTVLLNNRQSPHDRYTIPKKNKARKKFYFLGTLKLGRKIATNGFTKAAKHILNLIKTTLQKISNYIMFVIWKISKFVLNLLKIIFLGCLLILGFSGLASFIIGIHDNLLDVALTGMFFNYLSISILTFVCYYLDKRAARLGNRRTPEKQLHFLELGGGWLGAFCGQVLLHHKSSKESYQLVYWLIVIFHLSLWLFFIPASFPYAIPQKFVLIINAFLLLISLNAIQKKGNF